MSAAPDKSNVVAEMHRIHEAIVRFREEQRDAMAVRGHEQRNTKAYDARAKKIAALID
jgi:hypothetical protein